MWFALAGILLISTAPLLYLANWCFRRGHAKLIQLGLAAVCALGSLFLIADLYALADYGISPRETAYGSAFYLLNAFPCMLMLVGLALVVTAQIRLWQRYEGRDEALELHMQVVSLYWYFTVLAGVVVLATLLLST